MEVIAVDWSGDNTATGQRRHIWMATAEDGVLRDLSAGRTRHEVVQALLSRADAVPELVVGLDFAFSYPRWFLDERGLATADELWALAEAQGEQWLAACPHPFWGRPGAARPKLPADLRATDLDNAPAKSVFQIGGAGAVGTGSIRGMPLLRRLRDGGFSVWPFDQRGPRTVVEIYPRVLIGAVTKSDPRARAQFLEGLDLDAELRLLAEDSEDAFDAALSALAMSRGEGELVSLDHVTDPAVLLEGMIWRPRKPIPWHGPGRRTAGDPSAAPSQGPSALGDADDIGTPFQRHLQLRWSLVDEENGAIAVEMEMRDDLRGPAGSLEGGVISTLVDVAGASAVALRARQMVATEHIAVSFLAPGRIGPIRAIGVPLRVGKHDGVAEVRVIDTGRENRLTAVATVTLRILAD